MGRFGVWVFGLAFLLIAALVAVPAFTSSAGALEFATPVNTTQIASATCKPALLGIFVPWYQYLDVQDDPITGQCSVADFRVLPGGGESSDILLVALAIIDDLLRLAGLVAVVFVIYGGVQFVTSQGEPDGVNKGRTTILNSLIGLVIALTAIAFVAFLARALT